MRTQKKTLESIIIYFIKHKLKIKLRSYSEKLIEIPNIFRSIALLLFYYQNLSPPHPHPPHVLDIFHVLGFCPFSCLSRYIVVRRWVFKKDATMYVPTVYTPILLFENNSNWYEQSLHCTFIIKKKQSFISDSFPYIGIVHVSLQWAL